MSARSIDILAAFSTEPPPLDFVLPNMLSGTVGAIVSPGGAGKSMVALQLAMQIAGGIDLIGLGRLSTGSVVYFPAEDPTVAVQHRLHSLGAHLSPAQKESVAQGLTIIPLLGHLPDIMDDRWFDTLNRAADGSRLMILDTLRRFHVEDENASGPMAQVIGRMESISARTGCSIVFLHHSNKGAALMGNGDQQQASRGSSVLVDNIRWQSFVAGMSKTEAEQFGISENDRSWYVRFGLSKINYGSPFPGVWLKRSNGGVLLPISLGASLPPGRRMKEVREVCDVAPY